MLQVAITGPESTGKSTLSTLLARHYHTVWVPEFARTYLDALDRPYTPWDLEQIAAGQLAAVRQALPAANRILFCDTELLVIKIWSEHAFGHCPGWILEELARQPYNLYLLLHVDLPWEPDPQREHPHLRAYFYERYKAGLQQYGFPFVEISGTHGSRFEKAVRAIDAFLSQEEGKGE
jgi:NadR type nicotinamide-nucleotide adenylyltransferase